MTVLTMIQEHCSRSGIPAPAAAASVSNVQAKQLFALMNEMLEDLVDRKVWQQVTQEATHTTLAQADQGLISTIAPGFVSVIPDSFFNRTQNLRVYYGLTPEQWQSRQVVGSAPGPSYWARIRLDHLYLDPPPPADDTLAFEYRSEYFVKDAVDSSLKATFTKDGDTFVLPERVGHAWLRWRWKAEKGLDYAEEFRLYENHLEALGKRDNGPQVAQMGRCEPKLEAGVVIPLGNWPL